jgi:polar amino acid transport system substrate-binding protein
MKGTCVRRILLLMMILYVLTGCGLPRDPKHTLERVQHEHSMRVGLSENPPWVINTPQGPAGAEVELVREFANDIGARPQWIWGPEQQHMRALKHFELDLLAAGLAKSTPYSNIVGITGPYFQEHIVVGVPGSMRPPASVEGMTIAVQSGNETAAILMSKHAHPQRVSMISARAGPVAAPEWRIEQLGFAPTDIDLITVRHVMAAPPGENGWIMRLEQFLFGHESDVKRLLLQQQETQ